MSFPNLKPREVLGWRLSAEGTLVVAAAREKRKQLMEKLLGHVYAATDLSALALSSAALAGRIHELDEFLQFMAEPRKEADE
jgi:hypothetical protein